MVDPRKSLSGPGYDGLRDRLTASLLDRLVLTDLPTQEELAWDSLSFRRRLLYAAGFDARDAFALALHPQIALEDALSLLARGCPPAAAARILV